MSIDPITLPDGTVVEIERCVFAIREDGQISIGFVGGMPFMPKKKPITRVFVPVPDGMTLADAEAALADAGAWVGVIDPAHCPDGARMMNRWTNGLGGDNLYVHRDDLPPTDPDAELVAAIEKSVPIGSWDGREVLRRLRAEGFDVTHEAAR